MVKKNWIIICLLMLTIFLHNQPIVYGEVHNNVLDCIENEENCEEQEEEPVTSKEDDQQNQLLESNSDTTPSLFFSILKMVIGLLFVLGLIYLILFFLRKKNKLYKHSNTLENLGGISLGQNKSIQLIRLGSKIYLVGVGERVELMTEVTEEEIIEKLLIENEEEETYSLLKDFLSLKRKTNEKDSSNDPLLSQLRTELDDLRENRSKLVDKFSQKDDEHV